MSALGNIGTGNLTTVLIKEEPSLVGTIATASPVWLRKNRAFFQRLPNVVDSDFANAISDGISKEVFHTTAGLLAAETDMTTIGWLLKWFVGTKTSSVVTAGQSYKHVFKPGLTTLKSCKVLQNLGGMSTALNDDFLGQAIDRMAIIANILETVKCETVWVGITDQSGTLPAITGASKANPCVITSTAHTLLTGDTIKISGVVGMTELNGNTYTVTKINANSFSIGVDSTTYTIYTSGGVFAYEGDYATENKTVSFRDDTGTAAVKFYVGTVGETTIASMVNWTDPYYMRFDMARNRKVDNFVSDGTGKSTGITDGIFRVTINLITTLTTNQKYSDFRSGTEKSFGVRLDTGVVIGESIDTYKLDIIFPRVTITNYDLNVDGIGTILPAVNLKPQKDPTAGYEVAFELFNAVVDTTSYPDST